MQLKQHHDLSAFAHKPKDHDAPGRKLGVVRIDPEAKQVQATTGRIAVIVPDECEDVAAACSVLAPEMAKLAKSESTLHHKGKKLVSSKDGSAGDEVSVVDAPFPNFKEYVNGKKPHVHVAISAEILIRLAEYLKKNGCGEDTPVVFAMDERKGDAQDGDSASNIADAVRFMFRMKTDESETRVVVGALCRYTLYEDDFKELLNDAAAACGQTPKSSGKKKPKAEAESKPKVEPKPKKSAVNGKKPKAEEPADDGGKPAKNAQKPKPTKNAKLVMPTIDETWPESVTAALAKVRDAINAVKPAVARRHLVFLQRDVDSLSPGKERQKIEAEIVKWNEAIDVTHELKKGNK